jgi:hypothetical protein
MAGRVGAHRTGTTLVGKPDIAEPFGGPSRIRVVDVDVEVHLLRVRSPY